MKRIINLIAVASIAVVSCTKSANTPANSNNNSNTAAITGSYIITKFTDAGSGSDDESTNFDGYVFTFTADGKINAVKGGVTTQGTYTQKPAHEGEAAKLTISFSDAFLSELNKKWQEDLVSESAIHLSDDDNAAEVLQFSAK